MCFKSILNEMHGELNLLFIWLEINFYGFVGKIWVDRQVLNGRRQIKRKAEHFRKILSSGSSLKNCLADYFRSHPFKSTPGS